MKKLVFVVTTPFAVNAFLSGHLIALAREFDVLLCVNLRAYELTPALRDHVRVAHIDIVRKIAPLADLKALFQLGRLLLAERPDAVHSMTPKAGLLAMLAGFLTGVSRRHHTFTGQIWATRRGLDRSILKAMDRAIVMLSTKVWADSASQCRFIEREGVVATGRMEMLGPGSISGVDLNRFRPAPDLRDLVRQEMRAGSGSCVFLFVGRMTRDKGVTDLLEAFEVVARTDSTVQLWLVGPDEENLERILVQENSSLRGRIRWVGASVEPERWMVASDVLVLASYREGFGSVIIEAAACQIPAVAYRIDGVIDAVGEDRTGLLVSRGDITSLALAMTRLAQAPALREGLGAAARQRVERHFSSVSISEAWISFYRSELGL